MSLGQAIVVLVVVVVCVKPENMPDFLRRISLGWQSLLFLWQSMQQGSFLAGSRSARMLPKPMQVSVSMSLHSLDNRPHD